MPSDREIEMTRVFDAPRELVWAAYTEPRHVPKWWGPGGPDTIVESMDVRPGGEWRWVVRQGDDEYGFHGKYVEVVPPEKLVYTFVMESMPEELTYALTFDEVDGKTRLTSRTLFASKDHRDGVLSFGMEAGANAAWDKLADVLASLREHHPIR